MMPRVMVSVSAPAGPTPSTRDTPAAKNEYGHGDACRERADAVLEVLDQAGPGPWGAAADRDGEPKQNTRDRRVDARLVHQHPCGDGQRW
jgi:hypothetical protein